MQVYGIVPNAKGMFVPGSRVRVRLTIGKPYMAMLVPDTAILPTRISGMSSSWTTRKLSGGEMLRSERSRTMGCGPFSPADKLAEGENIANWQVIVDNLQRARLNYPVEVESRVPRWHRDRRTSC